MAGKEIPISELSVQHLNQLSQQLEQVLYCILHCISFLPIIAQHGQSKLAVAYGTCAFYVDGSMNTVINTWLANLFIG